MNTFRKFINEMKDVSQFNTRKIDIEFGIEMYTGKTKEGKDFYLLKKDGSYVGKTPQRVDILGARQQEMPE